ncbi:MAG: hypothetical protein ACOCR6_01010 [archaeon]
MPDTKAGREKQAARRERRQREREIAQARERADEAEPAEEADREAPGTASTGQTCHIRACDEPATFVVIERYREETGQGAVVAGAVFCAEHAARERPTNLEADFEEYLFLVEPISAGSTD